MCFIFQCFHKDKVAKKRLLKSYKLMLDFYGIQLVNEETGEVQRAKNWKERFENLNKLMPASVPW